MIDHPVGYKAHAKSTPYLGGGAILCGFFGARSPMERSETRALPHSSWVPQCCGSWERSTIASSYGPRIRVSRGGLDRRARLGEWSRLVVASGGNLGSDRHGSLDPGGGERLQPDGQPRRSRRDRSRQPAQPASPCSRPTRGLRSSAALAVAVCGACIGFLHFNLSKPAKIFLGDGGSMLLGFPHRRACDRGGSPERHGRARDPAGDPARRTSRSGHDSGDRLASTPRRAGRQGGSRPHHSPAVAEAGVDLGSCRGARRSPSSCCASPRSRSSAQAEAPCTSARPWRSSWERRRSSCWSHRPFARWRSRREKDGARELPSRRFIRSTRRRPARASFQAFRASRRPRATAPPPAGRPRGRARAVIGASLDRHAALSAATSQS